MTTITVSAPGKLHLIGEHSVVYGAPALLSAVNKRCYVTLENKKLSSRPSPKDAWRDLSQQSLGERDSPQGHLLHGSGASTSLGMTKLEKPLQKYIDLCLKEALNYFGKIEDLKCRRHPSWSLIINLESDIPLGSGMGSSAAIAVAVAGAVSQLVLGKIDKEKVNEIAFACEKYVHSNPSGGDNATCTYGGIIWYRRKNQESGIKNQEGNKFEIKQLPFFISDKISSQFFIINTGKPDESTKEMVERIRIKNQESRIKNIFDEQGKLAEQLLYELKKENSQNIIDIIRQSEQNLEAIGVVSASTQQLIRAIEKTGFAAKVCGAGGFANASGIVLAFGDNFVALKKISQKFGLQCEKIKLGEEGVRVE